MSEDYSQGKAGMSYSSNIHSSQEVPQTNGYDKEDSKYQDYPSGSDQYMEVDANYIGQISPNKSRSTKSKLEEDYSPIPVNLTKSEPKKKRAKKQKRFEVDESIKRKAEEDSELLDSLIEISERQLQTEREVGEKERKENSLLNNLLEQDQCLPPFDFDSY